MGGCNEGKAEKVVLKQRSCVLHQTHGAPPALRLALLWRTVQREFTSVLGSDQESWRKECANFSGASKGNWEPKLIDGTVVQNAKSLREYLDNFLSAFLQDKMHPVLPVAFSCCSCTWRWSVTLFSPKVLMCCYHITTAWLSALFLFWITGMCTWWFNPHLRW